MRRFPEIVQADLGSLQWKEWYTTIVMTDIPMYVKTGLAVYPAYQRVFGSCGREARCSA